MAWIARDELERRWARVRRFMECDAMIVLQNVDLFYLTGTVQDGVLWFPRVGEPVFAVRKSLARAREESPLDEVVPFHRYSDLPSLIPSPGGVLGLEFDVVPVATRDRIAGAVPTAKLVDQSMAIRQARAVKTAFELDAIRRAAEILDQAFLDIPGQLRKGLREFELGARLEYVMRMCGHQGFIRVRRFNMEMFYGAVAFGETAAYPHNFDGPVGVRGLYPAVPLNGSDRELGVGEPVMVDLCGGFGGYIADASRAYSLGQPDPQILETHAFLLELNRWIESRLRPGAVPEEILSGAMERVEATSYREHFMGAGDNRVRFIGHGVGLELDELPVIAPGFSAPLEVGMVLAVEPKVFFPGLGGGGIENTYAITADGFEKLNRVEEEWIVVPV
jgi:Xaa-Pro aminopeptidase